MNRTRPDDGLCPYITGRFISEYGTTLRLVNSFLNIPFALTATLGNALIIWTIVRTKSLHSPSNILLFGLALSDFFAGLFVQPLYIAYQLRVAEVTGSPSISCYARIAFNVASRFVVCTSLITLAAVSLERYVALRLHLRYKDIITIKRVVIFLVSVWILSAFVSATWLIHRSVTSLLTVILLIACVGISVFSCFKISVILRRHLTQIELESARVEGSNWTRDKKLAVVTLYLNCVFFFCFLPHACTIVVIRATGWSSSKLVAFYFTGTLVFINSILDPLIFCWRLKQIRVAVVHSISALCSRQKKQVLREL